MFNLTNGADTLYQKERYIIFRRKQNWTQIFFFFKRKILEGTVGGYLYKSEMEKLSLSMTDISKSMKKKLDIFGYFNITYVFMAKVTINKMKRHI